MQVRQEILEHSAETDKPILLWLLKNYHWESQWNFVARSERQRYGKLSYEVHRIWKPTKEGQALFAQLAASTTEL